MSRWMLLGLVAGVATPAWGAEQVVPTATVKSALSTGNIYLYDRVKDGKTVLVRVEVGACDDTGCALHVSEARDLKGFATTPSKTTRRSVAQLAKKMTLTASLPTEVKRVTVPRGSFMVHRYSQITHGGRYLERWDVSVENPGVPIRYALEVEGVERVRYESRAVVLDMTGVTVE